MITINGTVQDSLGSIKALSVTFVSQSTGQVNGAAVTVNTTKKVRCNQSTGAFSVTLAAGCPEESADVVHFREAAYVAVAGLLLSHLAGLDSRDSGNG